MLRQPRAVPSVEALHQTSAKVSMCEPGEIKHNRASSRRESRRLPVKLRSADGMRRSHREHAAANVPHLARGSTHINTPWYGVPLRAVALLGAVMVLPDVFFLLAFATGGNHAASLFFYDLVFSVFPGAVTGRDTGVLARAFAGWHASAPPVIWLAVAVLFGWLTRRVSVTRSIVVGLLVLLATVAAFRLLFAGMGWSLLVDTV